MENKTYSRSALEKKTKAELVNIIFEKDELFQNVSNQLKDCYEAKEKDYDEYLCKTSELKEKLQVTEDHLKCSYNQLDDIIEDYVKLKHTYKRNSNINVVICLVLAIIAIIGFCI